MDEARIRIRQNLSSMNFEITGPTYGRKDLLKILWPPIVAIVLLAVFYIMQWFNVETSELIIVGIIATFYAYRSLLTGRFRKLTFNTAERKLIIDVKALWGRAERIVVPFDNLKMEVCKSKWKWLFPTRVIFLKNKAEAYDLRLEENKISEVVMEGLITAATKEKVPVILVKPWRFSGDRISIDSFPDLNG